MLLAKRRWLGMGIGLFFRDHFQLQVRGLSLAMLSIGEARISDAFEAIEAKISELEGRLKNINKPERFMQQRTDACARFEANLNALEGAITQINQTETTALKRNTEAIQELNKKCKNLIENVSALMQQQSKITESECTHSRLSNSCLSSEGISVPSEFCIEPQSPMRNYGSDDTIGTDSDLTLSPSLRKLLKSPPVGYGDSKSRSSLSSSDLCTPPYISKRTPGNPGNKSVKPGNGPLLNYSPMNDNTPKLENIGLSKRSFEFIKSLVSTKDSNQESENIKNQSGSSDSEKSSLGTFRRFFSFGSKTEVTSNRAISGISTTPLSKKYENSSLNTDSSFVLVEQNSFYADAEPENPIEQENQKVDSDTEIQFTNDWENKKY